jgi:glycosyltransferase involved in cell wall biosynthesis
MHTGKTDLEFQKTCLESAGENVNFLGSLNKQQLIEQLVTSELCVVNPMINNKEVFCACAVEAMATGTPILAGGNSLIDPIVAHGGQSYAKDLSTAIIFMMSDEKKRRQSSEEGKRYSEKFRLKLISN